MAIESSSYSVPESGFVTVSGELFYGELFYGFEKQWFYTILKEIYNFGPFFEDKSFRAFKELLFDAFFFFLKKAILLFTVFFSFLKKTYTSRKS